jgi:hypothetical protein
MNDEALRGEKKRLRNRVKDKMRGLSTEEITDQCLSYQLSQCCHEV